MVQCARLSIRLPESDFSADDLPETAGIVASQTTRDSRQKRHQELQRDRWLERDDDPANDLRLPTGKIRKPIAVCVTRDEATTIVHVAQLRRSTMSRVIDDLIGHDLRSLTTPDVALGPVPSSTRRTLTMMVTADVHCQIKAFCREQGFTISGYLRSLLASHMPDLQAEAADRSAA